MTSKTCTKFALVIKGISHFLQDSQLLCTFYFHQNHGRERLLTRLCWGTENHLVFGEFGNPPKNPCFNLGGSGKFQTIISVVAAGMST